MKVQLNVRLSPELREKIRSDSDRFGRKVTRDVVVASIAEDFFSSWNLKEREAFYRKFLAHSK